MRDETFAAVMRIEPIKSSFGGICDYDAFHAAIKSILETREA